MCHYCHYLFAFILNFNLTVDFAKEYDVPLTFAKHDKHSKDLSHSVGIFLSSKISEKAKEL